jgi:hypothetical protein
VLVKCGENVHGVCEAPKESLEREVVEKADEELGEIELEDKEG